MSSSNLFDREKKGERAVLVLPYGRGSGDAARRAAEFMELARSAGAEVLGQIAARVDAPNPRFCIGSGKADEVAEMVRALQADLVLVDRRLTPVQERNLEKHVSARVVDRAGLILDIFAQRARSHEGKLEVELAQLKHIATRLVRGWTHLDAQRGGAIGNRGPGETQLETDRRLLGERVKQLGKRLEKVQTQRGQQRRARLRNTVPRVALVGYTNAGKSTLFNALTSGGVYAADQLFATLDPTVRQIDGLACSPAVLADTVGFVRELPHDLVAAFRGTLAEARDADLLLHVSDASDEERGMLQRVVDEVLEEIGAGDVPQLHVCNKIDLMGASVRAGEDQEAAILGRAPKAGADVPADEDQEAAIPGCTFQGSSAPAATMDPRIDRDADGKPHTVWLSAASGAGMHLLRTALGELLGGERVRGELALPLDAGRLHARLRAVGAIAGEQVDEHGWRLRIDAPRNVLAPLSGGEAGENAPLRDLLARA